jgi:hypothetical protein
MLDVTFDRDENLHFFARMTGPHRVSANGNEGYSLREHFDWRGRAWLLSFQAWVKASQTQTTHLLLAGESDKDQGAAGATIFDHLMPALIAQREARERGWRLFRTSDGVTGQFDPDRLLQLPRGGLGSNATFNVEINGLLYWGQLLLREQPQAMERPTAWDWTKGAKAGLPSLGKRR